MRFGIVLGFIFLLTLLGLLAIIFFPLKLGLDLQGGVQLVLQSQMDTVVISKD